MKTAIEILHTYWGASEFRSPQEAIIQEVADGKDVIAVLPTGLGKSVCFQVPVLMRESGICIVISPLVALMRDQVAGLQQKGIKALALTGTVSHNELIRHFDNIRFGNVRFLYISPERLESDFIQEKLKQLPVSLIAIDEAHCISEWGHDFRPSYLKLSILRELFFDTNIIALTATATSRVIEDIKEQLELRQALLFRKVLVRDNLQLQIIKSSDKLGTLLNLIENVSEPVIVYAGTRKNCQQINNFINHKEGKSAYYHAGLSPEEKEEAYIKWYTEEKPVMVATNAFGMGIDKANVRWVIHTTIPASIENYVQEFGRAGRDGRDSYAILITDPTDISGAAAFYINSLPDVAFIKKLYHHLNQYFQIPYGAISEKKYDFQWDAFCERYALPVVKTYKSLELLEREHIIKLYSKHTSFTQVHFTTSNEQLFSYYQRNPSKEQLLKMLLRTYDGIFIAPSTINPVSIAKKLNISIVELKKQLIEIQKDGIINYQSGHKMVRLQFMKIREDDYTIHRIAQRIEQQRKVKSDKYQSMLSYITNTKICRNRLLSDYFDENTEKDCGMCDVCKKKTQKDIFDEKAICKAIIEYLERKTSASSKEIIREIAIDIAVVLKGIRILLDEERIVLTSHNQYKLYER